MPGRRDVPSGVHLPPFETLVDAHAHELHRFLVGLVGPTDAEDMLAAAADAGADVELHVCATAEHAASLAACPEDYAGWVLGFLELALADPG